MLADLAANERSFHNMAPLYLKLLLRYFVLGFGIVKSYSLFLVRRIQLKIVHFVIQARAVARTLIGGCIFIYSGSARLTSFESTSFQKKLVGQNLNI